MLLALVIGATTTAEIGSTVKGYERQLLIRPVCFGANETVNQIVEITLVFECSMRPISTPCYYKRDGLTGYDQNNEWKHHIFSHTVKTIGFKRFNKSSLYVFPRFFLF